MCNSRVKSTETSEQVDNTSQLIAAITRLTKAVCLQNLRLHKSFRHCYVCPVPAYTYLTCLPVLLCFLLLRRLPLHSHLLRNDQQLFPACTQFLFRDHRLGLVGTDRRTDETFPGPETDTPSVWRPKGILVSAKLNL